ncbi:hypothetical protein D3C80_1481580 [compost metagenome]
MFCDLERKLHVFQFLFCWCALGDDLEIEIFHHAIVTALNQKATGNSLGCQTTRTRVWQTTSRQQTQVWLARNDGLCLFRHVRSNDHFREQLDDLFRRLRIQRLVKRNHATKCRD